MTTMTENERHYPDIIFVGEGCSISNCDIKISVSYGKPIPPEPVPVEPPQLPITEAERAAIRQELQNLASEIQDVLRDFALLMHEAAKRMGLGEGWCNQPDTVARIMEWRTSLTEAAGVRYLAEIRSRFIDAYEHAWVRGFFDPELESHYTTRLLVVVENHLLPGLRRALSRYHLGKLAITPSS
jgi:hypothetical protein